MAVPVRPPNPIIDAEAVQHWNEHKWTIIRNFTSPEWVEYLRETCDDRQAHPHFMSFFTGYLSGLFSYHQINSWMSTDGIFNFFDKGGESIHTVAHEFGNFNSTRLLHETLDLYPRYVDSWLPVHDDCAPEKGCGDFLTIRMYMSLDYVPHGRHLQFIKDDQSRVDPAFQRANKKDEPRFIPVPEIFPGDIVIWNNNLLHTSVHHDRRVLVWTVQDGKSPLVVGLGMAWLGLYDGDVFQNQESAYYPVVYPQIADSVVKEREERMTGTPGMWSVFKLVSQALYKTSTFKKLRTFLIQPDEN